MTIADILNGVVGPLPTSDAAAIVKALGLVQASGGTPATVDQGLQFLVPAGTTNGTVMPNRPATTDGFTLYLGDADVVTGYFAAVGFSPSGAPAATISYGPYSGGAVVDVPQASRGRTFFVTAITGTPQAIWVQR